jgi:hypothetical protein
MPQRRNPQEFLGVLCELCVETSRSVQTFPNTYGTTDLTLFTTMLSTEIPQE